MKNCPLHAKKKSDAELSTSPGGIVEETAEKVNPFSEGGSQA